MTKVIDDSGSVADVEEADVEECFMVLDYTLTLDS